MEACKYFSFVWLGQVGVKSKVCKLVPDDEDLYCRPFYSSRSGPFARPRDFENRLLNDVLANFGHFLPPLILEHTPTALLLDGQRHSFETVPNRSSTLPRAFFDNGRAGLGGLHSAAWNI